MENFGEFGRNKNSYMRARRGYPNEIFSLLKSYFKAEKPILDLGCGTGISTRQLVDNGFKNVQGVDVDSEMLSLARDHKAYNQIVYSHQDASKMTFRSRSFQGIACFCSFHWFLDDASIIEIKRVLKSSGVMAVINKVDVSHFRGEVKLAIEKRLGRVFPKIANVDEKAERLRAFNFKVESPKVFNAEDLYTFEEAIEYIKSTSFWAAVEEKDKKLMLEDVVIPILKSHVETKDGINEMISRRYQSICLIATAPASMSLSRFRPMRGGLLAESSIG